MLQFKVMERANECKCHRLAISVNKTLSCDYFEAKFRKAVQCVTQVIFRFI